METMRDLLENQIVMKIIVSIIIMLVGFIISKIALRYGHGRITSVAKFYKFRKTVNYTFYVLVLIILVTYWAERVGSLTTYFGLLSAGIAIALKDIIINIAAFLFIISRRPFSVGDRIQIGEVAGDVIDQRPFQFTLMEIGNWVGADQSTGRIVHIPNHFIFNKELSNYTRGFAYIWNEVPILLTFESNWREAKEAFHEIGNEHSLHLTEEAVRQVREAGKKFMIYYRNLTPIVYTGVKESGVQLTIRYLCEPQQRRGSEEKIWEDVLTYIEGKGDVQLAYPTLRVTKQ